MLRTVLVSVCLVEYSHISGAWSDGRWIPTRASPLMVLSIAPISRKTQALRQDAPLPTAIDAPSARMSPPISSIAKNLATLAVDVNMEVDGPMQRAPDGIAALESLSNQLEPGAVEDAAELHREGACRRLRFALSTSLAALELPPPRGTCNACMHARLRSMRRKGGWLQKPCAAQRRGVEISAQGH